MPYIANSFLHRQENLDGHDLGPYIYTFIFSNNLLNNL